MLAAEYWRPSSGTGRPRNKTQLPTSCRVIVLRLVSSPLQMIW